jgi:hydrogenase maturation protease
MLDPVNHESKDELTSDPMNDSMNGSFDGSMNDWNPFEEEAKPKLESVLVAGVELRPGDHVRLCPNKTADIFDLALRGQSAVIEAIEQDYDDKVHVAVILDNDPGRDLGALRQPGHRFFFAPDEVEPLAPSQLDEMQAAPTERKYRVLVAGIGNIFLGDDAFGVEVIRRLSQHPFPEAVGLADFGIRGLDLAYALMDGYEAVILADAIPRQRVPGTLYVIEPDLQSLPESDPALDAHSLDPVKVLAFARSMGANLKRIVVVGCEPASLCEEQGGGMGLSTEVEAAVGEGATIIRDLVEKLLRELPAQPEIAKISGGDHVQ